MAQKIHWVSRHELSPAQIGALKALHGEDAIIEHHKDVVFEGQSGLSSWLEANVGDDEFAYVVAGAPHLLTAALDGYDFGVFENHPGKRADGQFGLAAVYHVRWPYEGLAEITKVWVNPDPESDQGEALVPIRR